MAHLQRIDDLYRILLKQGFFQKLEATFYAGDMRCADIMLELKSGKMIRNKEFDSLHDAIAQFQPDLFSYHLGGVYNDLIHRKPMLDSMQIERRLFCMDVDCAKMQPGTWYSHCLYVCMLAHRVCDTVMPGSPDATLICYTGKGWHIYFNSIRLCRLPTAGRSAVRKYTRMQHLFKESKTKAGYETDAATGMFLQCKDHQWRGGCLYSGETLVFDIEWFQPLLQQQESFFLVASRFRQKEWMQEGGIVVSTLELFRNNAQSFAGKAKLESLQQDVSKGNIRTMQVLLSNLSRIALFCSNQKDPSIIASEITAKAAMMYSCVMHDAAICNLHTDVGMDSPGHMLRGILAPKKRGDEVHLSNPLGSIKDTLKHLQETATLTLEDIQPDVDLTQQPKLNMALQRFKKWTETRL